MILSVTYTLLQLLVFLAIGFWLARGRGYPRDLFLGVNRFLAGVALPLYFFTSIAKTNIEDLRSGWVFPIIAIVVIAVGIAVSAPVFRLLPFSPAERKIGIGLSTFANSGYIPLGLLEIFPLTLPFIAERFSTQTASLYVGTYLLVNSPLLWTLGNWLVAGTGRRPKISELFPPPFIGIVAGLAVVGFGLQGPLFDKGLPFVHVFKALEKIGSVTLPLIMVSLGAMISELGAGSLSHGRRIGMAAAVAAIRYIAMPLLFIAAYLLALKPLGFTPVQCWVVFLEMHVPPATNFSVMVSQSGRNEEHVSFTLLLTYLLYLLALPLYLFIFLHLSEV
jgi:malonate transporter